MWVAWVAKLSLFATTTIASSGRNCIIYPNSWPHWFCRSTRSSDKKSSLAPTNIHLLFFSLSLSLFLTTILVKVVLVRRDFISSCATSSVRKLSTRMINVWVNFPKSYIGNWMHFCSIKPFLKSERWSYKNSHWSKIWGFFGQGWTMLRGHFSSHAVCVWKPSSSLFYVVVRWAGKRRRRRRPVAQLAHS